MLLVSPRRTTESLIVPEPSDQPPQKSEESVQSFGKGTTLWQTIASVGAALFGVQSRKNRERDFTYGKPLHFIVVGIAMTLLLIFALVFIVRLMLHNAGM